MAAKRMLKRRGRPAKVTSQVKKPTGSIELKCSECENIVKCAADTSTVICSDCMMKKVDPPKQPKAPLTEEQKALKVARKLERAKIKAAKASGISYKSQKDLGYGRGWWLKKLFKTAIDHDGKASDQKFYSYGKEITRDEYETLEKAEADKAVTKAAKKQNAMPRGWHLKKLFEKNGKFYSFGKEITKAAYDKIAAAIVNKPKPKNWGQGWHFKKHFVAPDGSIWKRGKCVKKASK